MFEVRWEFEVAPQFTAEFAAAYGPAGDWVELFRQGSGYAGTELLQLTPTRWITIDQWDSRASYEAFRVAMAADYAALDARCARLTVAERKLGEAGD